MNNYIIFALGICVFLIVMLGKSIAVYSKIGQLLMETNSGLSQSGFIMYLIRFSVCFVVSLFFINMNVDRFDNSLIILLILLGIFVGKTLIPIIIIVSGKLGIYENGVVTFDGAKNFKSITSYTIVNKPKRHISIIGFKLGGMFLGGTAYINVDEKSLKKAKKIISEKCKAE